jgi:hypothetical protein
MGKILTSQMVHYLLIKKTISITTNMSKLICPKWQNGLLTFVQFTFFLLDFPIKKTKTSTSDFKLTTWKIPYDLKNLVTIVDI